MNKTLRIIIFIAVPLVVLLIVAKKQGWIGETKGKEVQTTAVKRVNIIETVIASGKIQPETELTISSEVSGEIIALPVKEGDRVQKGDLLVKINPDIYEASVSRTVAAVNSAKAALASAKAQLIEAEKNYKRNQKLFADKVISQAEMDAAKRAYEVARLGVESARYQVASSEATLSEARRNLLRTSIYAPQDGTISMLNSELGERVVGTAQMTGTDIMHLSDLENMEVLVEVNENDIVRVSQGDTALIEVDAFLDEEFKGVITEIANSAKLEAAGLNQVTNFEVKVRILKSSYLHLSPDSTISPFRPGMTAALDIITKRKQGVLAVPIQAVTTRSDTSTNPQPKYKKNTEKATAKDFEVVFLAQEGKAQLQVVKTGIQDGENIEITKGLKVEQIVISGPYSAVSKTLDNGDAITTDAPEKDTQADSEAEKGE